MYFRYYHSLYEGVAIHLGKKLEFFLPRNDLLINRLEISQFSKKRIFYFVNVF